jgi:O-antigen/teichoic acid export membrane protein
MTKAKTLAVAATSSAGARLVSNSRWNLFAFGISLVINFATIPIVISYIGLEAFGAAGLVIAIYAPFMLVGTVLGQAMVGQLSPQIAAGDFELAAPVLSAGLFMCAAGGLAVVALLALAGEASVHLLSKQSSTATSWSLAFFVAGIGWAAQQGVLVLQATVAATQRYASLAWISVASAVTSAASIVAGAVLRPDYLGFLLGTSAGFLLSLALWVVLVGRLLPRMFPLRRFGRRELLAIAEFGKWQGGAHFVGAVGNQVDRYVLGVFAPLSVVGQYNVAMRLQEVVHMGLLKATEVLFPHFTVTAGDPIERRASFFIQASWILNVLGVAALAPLIPLAGDLLTLWVNKETASGGAPMLRTLAAAGILGCGVNVYYYFAIGTGQSGRIASLTVAHAVLTVVFTYIAIKNFGSAAAGAGYLVANAIRLGVTLWFTGQHFSTTVAMRKLIECTLPPLIVGLLLAVAWWRSDWLAPSGWAQLMAAYATVACSVVFGSVAATVVSNNGRLLTADTLSALRRLMRRGT